MNKNVKRTTRMSRNIKQQDNFVPRRDSAQNNTRENISRGVIYIVITGLVLFALLYVFPVMLNFDISAFLQGEKQLGIMRAILGVVLLTILCISLVRIVHANTLDGESFFEGLRNAFIGGHILRNLLSIVILAIGGIVLIVWGITGIML